MQLLLSLALIFLCFPGVLWQQSSSQVKLRTRESSTFCVCSHLVFFNALVAKRGGPGLLKSNSSQYKWSTSVIGLRQGGHGTTGLASPVPWVVFAFVRTDPACQQHKHCAAAAVCAHAHTLKYRSPVLIARLHPDCWCVFHRASPKCSAANKVLMTLLIPATLLRRSAAYTQINDSTVELCVLWLGLHRSSIN